MLNVTYKGNVAYGLIETSAQGSEYDDLFGIQGQRVLNGEFKVGFVFVMGKLNDLRSFVGQRSKVEGRGIQISDDDIWVSTQREDVARAAICGDDEVIVMQKGAGFVQIGQVAVGKNDDTFWGQKNPPKAEDGCK